MKRKSGKKSGKLVIAGGFALDSCAYRLKKGERVPPDIISPVDFIECLKRSLCRVSAYVNHSAPATFATRDQLTLSDGELLKLMEDSAQSATFAILFCNASDENLDHVLHPYDLATNFFYGSLTIGNAPGITHKRLNWTVTENFLTHGYDGLVLPDYSSQEINPGNLNLPAILELCCTNYFTRNLWHNYVHTAHHLINQSNYRQFAGTARHAMDFEADNWSNILLVESYGHRVRTDNQSDRTVNQAIIRLLRQNKCDNLFSIRAGARKEDQRLSEDHLEHLDESEWRFRRTVASYVSGWLLFFGGSCSAYHCSS